MRANYIGSRWLSNVCHIPCSKYGCHFLQQSVLRKVNPQDALQIANPIMTALLQMLNAGTGVVGGVQEDALMAIGTLVEGK